MTIKLISGKYVVQFTERNYVPQNFTYNTYANKIVLTLICMPYLAINFFFKLKIF